MYKKIKAKKTTININTSVVGEPIETKIERMISNNEPIGGEVDLNYTERDELKPGYDIRTDRAEIALDAVSEKNKTALMKREERMAKRKADKETKNKDSKTDTQTRDETKPNAGKGGNETTTT